MMCNKLYLLVVILSVFVLCSLAEDEKPRKSDSALDSKKKTNTKEKNVQQQQQQRQKPKQRKGDDDYDDDVDFMGFPEMGQSLSGYADNRYTAYSAPEGNYRTRSRWSSPSKQPVTPPMSSPFDDFMDQDNDWTQFENPNSIMPISLPPIPFDYQPKINNAPTCHSLVDAQYPVFSDVCGAVPQARYALPNSFGHHERWQIAQLLTNLVSSSTEPGCTRSLRLLLCPVLFPPCQSRLEAPPVLPCQSYCRAVKSRCALPALDILPCEILPHASDICPTNQAYGSFIPPATYPSLNQQSPVTNGFPSSNYPLSRSSLAALQALLASQGLQSQLNQSPFPQGLQSQLNPSSLPSVPQGLQSQLNPSSYQSVPQAPAQQTAQSNLYNNAPYSTEGLNSMFGDLSSQSNGYDYRQNSRYSPLPRSSTETRPSSEIRYTNMAQPGVGSTGVSSIVKA